jgi:ParB/RepB/Spo0J family partition protein
MARSIDEAVQAHVAAKLPPPAFELIPLVQIHPSPLNPRKRFDSEKHAELVESVKVKGVIVPVMVRPLAAGGFELVYGERRYRAANEAGLTHLPALVRAIEDREVVELALTENVDRDDMSPIDEGCAYRKLVELGRTVDELAALVGKKKGTIYGRMKLSELQGPAREAVERGELHSTVGVAVARLPTNKMQDDAFALLVEKSKYYRNGLKELRYEEATGILQAQFNLKLKDAPFDTKDPNLVEGCGACTACPKRTGAQPDDLFKDVKADTCIDRACYQAKAHANAAKVKQELKEKAEETGVALLPRAALTSTEYVDLEKKVWDHATSSEKKVKSIFGKHAPEIAGAVVDKEGRVHHLVKAADAEAALKKLKRENLSHSVLPSKSSGSDYAAAEARRKAEAEFRERVEKRAMEQLVAAAEGLSGPNAEKKFLQVAIDLNSEGSWRLRQVAERRGTTEVKLKEAVKKYAAAQLRGLYLDLLLCEAYRDDFSRACEALGLDFSKIEDAVKAEGTAAAESKKPAKAKKGKAA